MVGNTKIPDLTMKPNMSFGGTMSGLNTMSQNMRTKTTTPSMGVMSLSLPKTNIQTPTRQRAPQPTAPVTQPTTQVRQTAPTQPQNILASNVQPNTFTQASNTLRSQLGRNPTFGEVDSFMSAGSTPTPNVSIDTSNVSRDLSRPEPSPVSQEQSFINELRQRYLGSTEMSPEEIELQRQLADVQSRQAQLGASEQLGLAREEGRAIAMPFITGRQAELSRQAAARQQALAAEAQPLTQELALRQAQRQLAQQRALKNLEFAQQDITSKRAADQAALGSIQEFGGQLLRIRPDGSTEVIAEAPTGAGDFEIREVNGSLVRVSPSTGEFETLIEGEGEQMTQLTAAQLEDAVAKGYTSSNDIALYRQIVNAGGVPPNKGDLTVEQGKAQQFATAASSANDLLESIDYEPGLVQAKFTPQFLRSKERQQFDRAARAFVNATLRRESGATITDDEFRNKYQELIPVAGDKPEVIEDKRRARQEAVKTIAKAAGAGFELEQAQNPFLQGNITDPFGFNQVGNDTNQVARIAESIGQFESGGNYQARGPVVTSGRYKGERALGKYQIMPGNLPQWSREILGYEVTPDQFLANPQIQDAIAQGKMAQTLKKYGTVEDVASVWFSGQPVARAGNRSDVLGTTVPQYVQNVVSNYNRRV